MNTRYTIHQFRIANGGKFTLPIPVSGKILNLQVDEKNGQPHIWVQVPYSKHDEEVSYNVRHFITVMTGEILPKNTDDLEYIGMFQIHQGSYVGHLFEIKKEQ